MIGSTPTNSNTSQYLQPPGFWIQETNSKATWLFGVRNVKVSPPPSPSSSSSSSFSRTHNTVKTWRVARRLLDPSEPAHRRSIGAWLAEPAAMEQTSSSLSLSSSTSWIQTFGQLLAGLELRISKHTWRFEMDLISMIGWTWSWNRLLSIQAFYPRGQNLSFPLYFHASSPSPPPSQ